MDREGRGRGERDPGSRKSEKERKGVRRKKRERERGGVIFREQD